MDEEEETVVVMWNFLQLLDSGNRRDINMWVHPYNLQRNLKGFMEELRADPKKFFNYCRMTISTFDYVLSEIAFKINKKNTSYRKAITPEERLLLTLRFLATGQRFQYMHFNHRIGASTAGKIVNETCVVICEVLSPKFLMTKPTTEAWTKIAEKFEELWNYSNCCGAIDGKHIRIEAPWNSGSLFFNHKQDHSIVLQAIVDADTKFVIVDLGEAGKNSDGGVFISSTFGKMFKENQLKLPKPRPLYDDNSTQFPYVFVGDEAYALYRHMMKPYSRASLTKGRRIYNYSALSRAKNYCRMCLRNDGEEV